MTDDTDHDERWDDERAVSLPLLDTFAALETELAAKEDRIERLESELAEEYLDPDGETDGSVDEDGTDTTAGVDEEATDATTGVDDEPRSHEDWEPETDPLEGTGAVEASTDDYEGVTAEAATSANETAPAKTDDAGSTNRAETRPPNGTERPDTTPTGEQPPTDDSGLKPVRTAGDGGDSTAAADADDLADREYGVQMQTSSNLTGGSLNSSADGEYATDSGEKKGSTDDEGTNDGSSRPDPTADRGERLSLLVRRAELRDEDAVVDALVSGIDGLDDVTVGMLAHYHEAGDAAPVDAHVAAGGSGERQYAYARNRTLRKAGVIEHDGAGRYRYALPDLVEEAFDGHADGQTLTNAVAAIESATGIDE